MIVRTLNLNETDRDECIRMEIYNNHLFVYCGFAVGMGGGGCCCEFKGVF